VPLNVLPEAFSTSVIAVFAPLPICTYVVAPLPYPAVRRIEDRLNPPS
jgi:hypothetical protein